MSTIADFELPPSLKEELARNAFNPCVGHILLSQSDRARVWYIGLRPGERIGFHRHVLDYFWTALTVGSAVSHIDGGPPKRADYFAGQTQHMSFAQGEYILHDLQNIGTEDLVFITVEHLESANAPIALPSNVKPQPLPARIKLP